MVNWAVREVGYRAHPTEEDGPVLGDGGDYPFMDVSSNGFAYDCFGKFVRDNLKRCYLNIAIETNKARHVRYTAKS